MDKIKGKYRRVGVTPVWAAKTSYSVWPVKGKGKYIPDMFWGRALW